ncbi:MAG: homoserine dehydrogenase, partial [Chloroflexi bacterium]|nr:homoserine dehydrogenase [Chloroflexota bacterium]
MSDRNVIGIGLLGLGVVGSGVAATLLRKAEDLAHLVPCPLALRAILVRDIRKSRPFQPGAALLTTRVADLLETPQTDIIIEVMGGERPALDFIERALRAKKHVVTANKELMAKHGPALLALAEEHGVQLRFEA